MSIASRVVPGMSLTITRSSPSSALTQARLADVRPADDRDRDGLIGIGGHRGVPAGRLGIGRPVGVGVFLFVEVGVIAERRALA